MIDSSISIVIATRNSAKQLADAAARWHSAAELAQIVVQDGGSDDGTLSVLRELQQAGTVHVLNSGPDVGPYDAWNKALAHCTGDWVLFYGDADVVPVEWLKALRAISVGRFDIVTGELRICEESGDLVGSRQGWKPANKNQIFNDALLPHVGMAHSRHLFRMAQFDSAFRIAGDRDFLLRVWPFRVKNVPDVCQGVMVLGGLSNAPQFHKLALSENRRIMSAHGVSLSIRRRAMIAVKIAIRRYPRIWRKAHKTTLRLRMRLRQQ